MRRTDLKTLLFAIATAATLGVMSARAADCGESAAGFNEWLDSFKTVAIRDGVSPQVANAALNGVVYDPSVAAHDRGQGFGQSFAAFAARHITPGRIKRGKTMLLAYAEPFEKIEQRYGVPAPVLVAIWGLETDFGAGLGGYPTFSALATLAYDCRRAQIYRAELIGAGGGPKTFAWIARHADGWMTTPGEQDISGKAAALRRAWAAENRPGAPDIRVLVTARPSSGDFAAWAAAGVTELLWGLPDAPAETVEAYLDRLASRVLS